jgi:hypothetical protein
MMSELDKGLKKLKQATPTKKQRAQSKFLKRQKYSSKIEKF